MDEQVVRERTQAHCAALLAGEMDRAVEDFSQELRSNLGSVIAQLPLPLTEASVESIEPGGKGYLAVLHLVGESQEIHLQTRWKERDGKPTIVEASQLTEQVTPAAAAPGENEE